MPVKIPKANKKKKSSKKRKLRFASASGINYKGKEKLFYLDNIKNALDEGSSCYGFSHIEPEFIEDSKIYDKYQNNKNKTKLFKVNLNTKTNFVMRFGMLPGIIKAYFNNSSLRRNQPAKLWYFGDVFGGFSKELSQKTEAGIVLFGSQDAVYDVQPMIVARRVIEKLKIKNTSLKIGSTGCKTCKSSFLKKLKSYYKSNSRKICKKCADEYKKDPTSLSKCINQCEEDSEKLTRPPVILDSLCASCKKHLTSMLDILEELEIQYILDPHIIYDDIWAKTAFKITDENGAKLLEGGRMDNLMSMISKSRVSANGFMLNLNNISRILKENKLFEKKINKESRVFVISVGEAAKVKTLSLIEMFHNNKISAKGLFSDTSLKSRIDIAKKNGAKVVLIMGQKEVYDDVVIMRDIETSVQEIIPMNNIVKKIKKKI